MSTDNRTTLNDCSATTGWTGDDTFVVVSDPGTYYEGGSAGSLQFTNTDEHQYTTSIGGTRDLSDSTCWMLAKDNLVETQTNGGVKYVLYDGTNDIGYEIGGNDLTGLSLPTFWNAYRFDISNSAAFTAHAFAGSEASLSKTAITGIGFGTFHLAKAVGSIDNCQIDRFCFIVNGNPTLTINGGTSGTPITMATTAADDVTNGWGLIANPQGSQFNIFGAIEWGDSGTASTYFSEADSQLTFNGVDITTGNFDMISTCNATGTNLFQLDNCVVINLGAVANWDLSDTNSNTMEVTNTQFVDNGAFTLPVTGGTSRKFVDVTFVNCGQVNPSTCTFTGISFSGTTDANGALLIVATTTNMSDLSFTSDGTGHAIYITATGTYDFNNFTYSGYGAADTTDATIYNNSGGAVTINITGGGGTPTIRNGTSASTTVNNNINVTFTGMKDNTEVRVYKTSDDTSVAGIENATSGTTDNRSFAWSAAASLNVYYKILALGYEEIHTKGYVVPATDTSIPIQQRVDRNEYDPL